MRLTTYIERRRGRARAQAGFTLVEVLLAIAVLGISLAGLAAALMGAIASTEFSKAQTVALQDAKRMLEQLSMLPPQGEDPDAGPGTPGALLAVAWNINQGSTNPGANVSVPMNAFANLPGEVVTVDVLAPPNTGGPTATGVLVDQLPTANFDAYEIIVTVSWFQGNRPVSVTVRNVYNIL